MIKTSVYEPSLRERKLSKDMSIGEIGRIVGAPYKDEVVLRVYDGVVSLTNPQKTWGNECANEVEVLPEGSKIVIEVQ